MYTHTYIHMHMHIHTHTYRYIQIHTYTHISYTCICIHVHTCTYIIIHMHTYTYISIPVHILLKRCDRATGAAAKPRTGPRKPLSSDMPVSEKKHSFQESLRPARQQQKLLSSPWFDVFQAYLPKGTLLRSCLNMLSYLL